MSGPPVEHERTPQNRPGHRPQPTHPSSNPQPRRPRKRSLHDRTDTHEKEESPGGGEFRPIPEPPQGDMVKDGRHGECAHDGAGPPEERSEGTSSKHDENVSRELVPAEAPKLLDRGGQPRPVKEPRPCGSRLAKNDSPDQGREVVRGFDHRVRAHAATDAAERGQSGTGHEGKARVENTATLWVVRGGKEILDGVMRSVEHRRFQEHFEQYDGGGRRRGALAGEWP